MTTTTIRTTVRRCALGLGALALAFGTAGCGMLGLGGDSDDRGSSEKKTEAPKDDEKKDSEGDKGSEGDKDSDKGSEENKDSDGNKDSGGNKDSDADKGGASGPVSDADVEAAKGRFFEFLQATADNDFEKMCGYLIDPSTGKGVSEEMKKACAKGAGDTAKGKPKQDMSNFDKSMLKAEGNADGTVSIKGPKGQEIKMVKGKDGQWYLDTNALMESLNG